ncbi:MFS transporter [Microtetraspora malaysiensis]|uniref:MFS transporter n=1 Tax=Microtetraspora malaysiensis TaxID=161358 RepID=UPI003D8A7D84
MPWGLIALALGGFGIGLTEFGIVGLLPDIAAGFGVSEGAAGLLVSGYALSVAVGALMLTVAVTRFDRKHVLLWLMLLFIAGNLISAVAPSYGIMLVGRVIAALCHGAFFSVGAVVAADLVEERKKAGAISLMFAGLTGANVLGVPAGTFLGQAAGWRSTFWAITVIGVIALIGIALLVRPATTTGASSTNIRSELRVATRPQVLASAMVSVLAFGGLVGAFTYIAFTLTNITGLAESNVPWLLLLFGVGSFIGNLVGGKVADRALDRSLIAILAGLTVVLIAFALAAAVPIVVVILILFLGIIGFAAAPGLQLRIMSLAGSAPTLASGMNIAALNIGNALGAWISGMVISTALGFTGPLWTGAASAGLGLVVLLGTLAQSKSQGQRQQQASAVEVLQ